MTLAGSSVDALAWPPLGDEGRLAELLGHWSHYLASAERLVLHVPVTGDIDPAAVPTRPASVGGHAVDPARWDDLLSRTLIVAEKDRPTEYAFVLQHDASVERPPGHATTTYVVDPARATSLEELARASEASRDTAALLAAAAANTEALLQLAAPRGEVDVLVGRDATTDGAFVVADAAAVVGRPVPAGLRAITVSDVSWCDPASTDASIDDLVAAVSATGAWLVCASRHAGLMASLRPQLAESMVVVPVAPPSGYPNLDLREHLGACGASYDLTWLLLPLAATFARVVTVHGARLPVGDVADDYARYVQTFVRGLEDAGIEVWSGTDTDITALRRRQRPPVTDAVPRQVDLALLSPNFEGGAGHHAAYTRATTDAARARGLSAVTLAGRSLASSDDDVVPFFTFATGPLRSYPVQADTWRAEFRAVLTDWLVPGGTAFMDCAGFQHVQAVADVALEVPDRRVVINLMGGHDTVADAAGPSVEARAIRQAARAVLARARDAGVVVTVDTEALRADVVDVLGVDLPVLPMASIVDFDETSRTTTGDGRSVVLFPAQNRAGRGLDLLEQIAAPLLQQPDRYRVVFRPSGQKEAGRIVQLFDRLVYKGAEMADSPPGSDDEVYRALLASADVVVLPYDPAEFRTRTSGLVVDAVLAGSPVVTSRGTWGAQLVESLGGVSGDFTDPDDFVRAIVDTAGRSEELRATITSEKERLVHEFSLAHRLDFVLGDAPVPGVDEVPDHGVVLAAVLGPSAVRAGVGLAGELRGVRRELAELTKAHRALRDKAAAPKPEPKVEQAKAKAKAKATAPEPRPKKRFGRRADGS